MKILKTIVLQMLLLMTLIACGIFVMWLFDMLLSLEYKSVIIAGVKVGVIAWGILLIRHFVKKRGKHKE